MSYRTPVDLSTQKAEVEKAEVQDHPPPQEFRSQPELKELASKSKPKLTKPLRTLPGKG